MNDLGVILLVLFSRYAEATLGMTGFVDISGISKNCFRVIPPFFPSGS